MNARQVGLLVSAVIAVVLLGRSSTLSAETVGTTRPASFAGSWYPASQNQLTEQVDSLLASASPVEIVGKPLAVIAPHAGYRFSAPVAASGYRCLRGHSYKRVFVIAFSHRYAGSYQGVDVPDKLQAYATPLGNVPIDREVCDRLAGTPGFVSMPHLGRQEHSLELQLPFLQRVLGDFHLVPLLVGKMSSRDYAGAAEAICPWMDENTLIVVSTDFTHFGPNYGYQPFKENVRDKLTELADKAARPIQACDFDGFAEHLTQTDDTICGRGPVLLLLRILSMLGGADGVRTGLDTSGRMMEDWENSVTYQSFVFVRRPGALGEQERKTLLELARKTVTAVLNAENVPNPKPEDLPASLRKDGACFVTLKNHGQLRGCIGNMEAQGPLYKAVIDNAVSAATKDHRFFDNPVTPAELSDIDIEISYLTPMKRIKDTSEIVIGRHGLWIMLGQRRGVLLPQVAYEYGWTREEFLAAVCQKAGLPMTSWKRSEAELYSFEAEVFGEPKPVTTKPAADQ